MKAAFYKGNQTFSVNDVTEEPLAEGYVRVKVAFCGICGTDMHIYHGKMDHRVKFPQVIGHEVSGEIVALGTGVKNFAVGEKVAVRPLQPGAEVKSDNGCRHIGKNLKFIGIDTAGGMQNFWNVPSNTLHKLPQGLSLKLGALIEPLAVACHDIRLSLLRPGEKVMVLGGGPIGVLIALVAKYKQADVLLSEPNEQRRKIAASTGLTAIDPLDGDLVAAVDNYSDGALMDIVFEVSGVQGAVDVMTKLLRVRGKIVMVAIHGEARPVDLFSFFWKELKMIGARVYEPEDFDEAIKLAASNELPLEKLITAVAPLDNIQHAFETLDKNPSGMKYLIDCNC